MKRLTVLFISMLFLLNHTYSQSKYYFSSKALNEGIGTKQKPYRSLQKVSQLALQPGDTVFFYDAEINGNIILSNIHGSKKRNIVFTSYGKKKCIINGKNKEAFAITGSEYFTITNLALKGAGRKTGNATDGLKLVNCKNALIKNLDISGFQKSGLLLYNCELTKADSVYVHDNGFAGILTDGDYQKRISNNIHIINCRADNNPGDPSALDNHSGNGILAGNCKNVLIEYCTATNNGWDMPRIGNGPVGIWAYEADSVTIQYCISYHNKTAKNAADGGGFDLDGGVTNSIIQYCLSYENWGSGYGIYQYSGAGKWYNNIVRYCISINDGNITDKASAMLIWNGGNGDSTFTNFYAYNNFFYNNLKYAFGFHNESRHRQFYFCNNIFVASDTSDIFNGIDSSANDILLGNLWMNNNGGFRQNGFTDIAKWASATGYELYAKKPAGTVLQQKVFTIPQHINITDPHKLKTNALLHSLCINGIANKGIDIKKAFGINVSKADFFGHAILPAKGFQPGICATK